MKNLSKKRLTENGKVCDKLFNAFVVLKKKSGEFEVKLEAFSRK